MSSTGAAVLMSSRPRHLPLMLALTFSTGVIDAVGYLGLDRVFTGNMTGNVVVLGMALTGAQHLPVMGPVVALSGFLAGAACAGACLRGRPPGWSRVTTTLFVAIAAVLSFGGAYLFAEPHPRHAVALVITGTLGLAMGAQAGTARQVGVREVTTVVVTSTITSLAAESWFGNRQGAQLARRGSAVLLILIGATAGALLLRWEPGAGVTLSALVTLGVAVAGERDRIAAAAAAAAQDLVGALP